MTLTQIVDSAIVRARTYGECVTVCLDARLQEFYACRQHWHSPDDTVLLFVEPNGETLLNTKAKQGKRT